MKLRVVFTAHALQRARERRISRSKLLQAVEHPDKIEKSLSDPERFLIKTMYYNAFFKKEHLLMIICERTVRAVTVVTIIDTSKISKYF